MATVATPNGAPPPSRGVVGSDAAVPPDGPSPTSYEAYAPRSAAQRSRLARIASLTAGPTALSAVAPAPPSSSQGGSASSGRPQPTSSFLQDAVSPPPLPDASSAPPINDDDLLPPDELLDPVEASLRDTLTRTDRLTILVKHAASLRLALRASINVAEDVSRRHADLLRHSGELSAAADRLQSEEAALSRHAEEIGMPLRHYDAVDRIGLLVGVLFKDGGRTVVRGLAKLKVDGDDFETTLDEIDDAVEFFGVEGGGREAEERRRAEGSRGRRHEDDHELRSGGEEYYRRALALREAALFLIREAVADRISQTSDDVASILNVAKVPIAADKLEASLAYTRFHGISVRSNGLIAIVKDRLDRSESYGELLRLCRNSYCGGREKLLKGTVRCHMDQLRDRHGLVGMTRLASVFLIRICTVETALYLDFFGDKRRRAEAAAADKEKKNENVDTDTDEGNEEDAAEGTPKKTKAGGDPPAAAPRSMSDDPTYRDAEFQSYLTNLCSSLHRTIRRGLVSVHDLDTLCQIVSVLREERALANSSPTTLSAARAIGSVIVDAQERLIFCANAALFRQVVRFRPTPADLDYPDRLRRRSSSPPSDAAAAAAGEGSNEAAAAAAAAAVPGSAGLPDGNDDDDAVQAQLRVYENWFPPMRSVLKILSKIFRVVEPRVFEDIALQSVQSCTKCLKDGADHIRKKSGVVHADLFLVKHLLILREQLSPFDIQLRAVERQLDFSDAGKAVSRFLANRNRRLFSMSTENALVTLLREGVSVQESDVDSKRDLEDALRSACNDFIEHASSSLAGEVTSLVDRCKAAVSNDPDVTSSLKSLPFMEGTSVRDAFASTSSSLPNRLEEVTTNMSLYLENAATQSILLKPVARRVTRTMEEARRFVREGTVDGERGWNEEVRGEVTELIDGIEGSVRRSTGRRGGGQQHHPSSSR